MNATKPKSVVYSDFLQELQKELDEFSQLGTNYRKRSAELAVMVVEKVQDVSAFWNRDLTYQTVRNVFSSEDEERVKDVAKMLNVVWMDMNLKLNMPDDVKALLEKRKRKPFKMVLVD